MTKTYHIAPRPPQARTYLGDGLYAEFDGHHIWLIASNGISDLNRVALEPRTYQALVAVAADVWGKR